jgi:thiol-disulfide isomerase/thioredoxin
MFDTPLFICSTLCNHCIEFANIMSEDSKKFEDVVVLNIDVDNVSGKRPQAYYDLQNILEWRIKSVPTIVTPKAEEVLSGDDAFKWLKSQVKVSLGLSTGDNNTFSRFGDDSCILSKEDRNATNKFTDKKSGIISQQYERMAEERKEEILSRTGPTRELSPPIC